MADTMCVLPHVCMPLMTVTFDLLTSELLCHLLLMWVTSPLRLNVVWFSVFALSVGTGQTDEATDGCNA